MMDLKEAIGVVKNQARSFEAVQVIAEAIDNAAKIDQLTGEANARLSAAQAELDKIAKKANAERSAADKVLAAIADEVAAAKATAAQAKANAKTEETKAQAKVSDILASAEAKAADILSKAKSDRDALVSEIGALKADKLACDKDAKAAAGELSELTAKIEAAKAAVKKMIGE